MSDPRVSAGGAPHEDPRFPLGAKVIRISMWRRAEVIAVDDGTYGLRYADGETDRVPWHWLRLDRGELEELRIVAFVLAHELAHFALDGEARARGRRLVAFVRGES